MKTKLLLLLLASALVMFGRDFKINDQSKAIVIADDVKIIDKATNVDLLPMYSVPESFNYQAAVTDTSGMPISNESIGVKFSIIEGSMDGMSVYMEDQQLMTNKFGLITANVGEGNSLDNFSDIMWGMGKHYLKIEVMHGESSAYKMLGVTEILSVPYALEAKHARVADTLSQPVRWVKIDSTDNSDYTKGILYSLDNINLLQGVRVDMVASGNKQAVRGNAYPAAGDDGHKIGVIGSVSGEGSGAAEGLRGQAFSTGYSNDGVVGLSGGAGNGLTGYPGEETVGSYNTGVNGIAYNNVWGNTGVFGIVYGSVGVDNIGVVGRSVVNDGSDTIRNVGTRGHANGDGVNTGVVGYADTGVENYGVVGEAFGGEMNVAIHGVVDEGGMNYAGVFDGQVEVNGKLHMNDVLSLMPLNTAPANPSTGDLYLDATDNKVKIYIVDTWKTLAFE